MMAVILLNLFLSSTLSRIFLLRCHSFAILGYYEAVIAKDCRLSSVEWPRSSSGWTWNHGLYPCHFCQRVKLSIGLGSFMELFTGGCVNAGALIPWDDDTILPGSPWVWNAFPYRLLRQTAIQVYQVTASKMHGIVLSHFIVWSISDLRK